MGLFNKLFGLKDKINVHFIDTNSGQTIGVSAMTPDQLPPTFEVATTLTIHGEEWTVQEAIPPHLAGFIQSKKLILKLSKVQYVNPQGVLFSLATISNELPQTANQTLFNDFELTILEDDWRQNEFLNSSSLPMVDMEVEKIKDIWENHRKPVNEDFTAFNKIHVRDTIGEANLQVDFTHLIAFLEPGQLGCLKLRGNEGWVKDAFTIKTATTSYYGLLIDKRVTQLCIGSFSEDSITEIRALIQAYQLIFVHWYQGDIITADDEGNGKWSL